MKTAVQCDFDGTITEEDVSFLLLDAFAEGDWRQLLEDYMGGKMPVGAFNKQAFAMIKADKPALLDFMSKSDRVKVRPGFRDLLDYCSRQGFKVVIVSNGVDFYIEAILRDIGVNGIEFFAAQSRFRPEGMEVRYVGPDGDEMEAGFKEAYTGLLKRNGYSVVYLGNGISDIYPARESRHVFATGDLLTRCREEQLRCMPFADLHDVVRGLGTLSLS
ncbi:HAD-IB family phosphatase [Chloroflexota bacterium]